MTEAQIQSAIHRTLGSRPDVRLFRNHVGKVRDSYLGPGRRVLVATDRLSAFDRVIACIPYKGQVLNQRWHTFGLAPGSADLIGWVRGRFLSIEVKSATGRVRPDQQNWMNVVNSHGGIAFVARSVAEAVELLEQHLK